MDIFPGNPLGTSVSESEMTLSDNTTNDVSTSKHGFVPKGTNTGAFLKDDGTWSLPPVGAMIYLGASSLAGGVATLSTWTGTYKVYKIFAFLTNSADQWNYIYFNNSTTAGDYDLNPKQSLNNGAVITPTATGTCIRIGRASTNDLDLIEITIIQSSASAKPIVLAKGGSAFLCDCSGTWENPTNAAINRIDIATEGSTLAAGSVFYVYGISTS